MMLISKPFLWIFKMLQIEWERKVLPWCEIKTDFCGITLSFCSFSAFINRVIVVSGGGKRHAELMQNINRFGYMVWCRLLPLKWDMQRQLSPSLSAFFLQSIFQLSPASKKLFSCTRKFLAMVSLKKNIEKFSPKPSVLVFYVLKLHEKF